MRAQRTVGFILTFLALVAFAAPASAQQGLLTGRITDSETGQPVEAAQVQVLGGTAATGGLSNAQGVYRIQVAEGTYSILVEIVGYRPARYDGIRVGPGTNTFDMTITSMVLELEGVVVSASRGTPEKSTEAPATTFTISSIEIGERPVQTPVDYLRSAPGVDIISQGIQASNVVVRGFNNIFSGGLHMLTDHRLAGVPSLRVNLMHFIPSNEQDIDRMEVVLGPGSALYGPNTANGVVHILTKSPLDDQGTTVTFGGGQRSVMQGSFRSAFLLGDDFGFKLSGQYLKGDEWQYDDATELANRAAADAKPAVCIQDKVIRGRTAAQAQQDCARIGIRDYDLERYGLEARADWRFAENGTFVATYGRNNSSGIELTGLGAGQTVDWVYEFYQARVSKDRLFAQAYLNTSDAGDSYLLNSGVPLVDLSKLQVAQIQHGFGLADGRQDFTYGFDYIGTRPNTKGNINGKYEDDDNMDEWGVYMQSKSSLSDKVDFIVAGRMDHHSIISDLVYSPRAALVYRPVEDQSFRFSFNRAYSAPSSLNYFLDISNGLAPGGLAALGFGLRAYGTGRDGWSLQNADGTLKGFRSPFNPAGASAMVPMAGTTAFWKAATSVVSAQTTDASAKAILAYLGTLAPAPGSIGTMLWDPAGTNPNPTPLSTWNLPGVPSVTESNSESFELGYTGIIGGRLKISADIYRTTQNDFVSPLLVQTPLVLFNGNDIGKFITLPVVGALTQAYMQAGLPLAQAQAKAAADAPAIVQQLATGLASVPIGVVSSPEFSGGSDLIVSYRNVGDLTIWGGDLAFQWFLDDDWTLNGTYSHVNKDLFDIGGGQDPIALNAPTHKGSVSLAYRNVRQGFNAEGRVRFNNAFQGVSAAYTGEVPAAQIVDVNLGYQIPNTAATLQLAVSNLFNSENISFVGVPDIGRFMMVRMKYDLF